MKNENMLPSVDGHSHDEPSFPGLQRELIQLHEVKDSSSLTVMNHSSV